jgi:hypothetical protein
MTDRPRVRTRWRVLDRLDHWLMQGHYGWRTRCATPSRRTAAVRQRKHDRNDHLQPEDAHREDG